MKRWSNKENIDVIVSASQEVMEASQEKIAVQEHCNWATCTEAAHFLTTLKDWHSMFFIESLK
jgi:hypothetical protein